MWKSQGCVKLSIFKKGKTQVIVLFVNEHKNGATVLGKRHKSKNIWNLFLPVHISPALCGRSVWSVWVWLCNQNVRWSCRLPRLMPRQQLQQRPIRHLSPVLPLLLPAACCLNAWAGGPEGPPPGHHGCWDLQWHKKKGHRFRKCQVAIC